MNVYNGDNHEPFQLFDEVVSIRQPWRSATPGYNLPIIDASTPINMFTGFQNQPRHTNIHLVPINSEMVRLHLLNMLEQLCHIDRRPSNRSISIPHVKPIEPIATPIVIRQGVTYPQGTWLARLIPGLGE
jgi:hypothetical protein